jgi:ribosomal protein L11 methyltransferase
VEPRYPFVAVDVEADEADEVSGLLFELGASGVEERDDQTLVRGAGAGQVTLVGSFDSRAAADEALAALGEARPGLAARLEEVVGDAWRDAWKEHFAPFALTPRITVVPPWSPPPATREGELLLYLEPGRAFGTGLHASTAMVAKVLDASSAALAGAEVLDVGTGSGILALVALLLGAARVTAIDNDPDVLEVVRENSARNGLAERVTASEATVEQVTQVFPWVLANIEARVLHRIAPELARVIAPGGTLVLSGVLASEHDAMVGRYTSLQRAFRHMGTLRAGQLSESRALASGPETGGDEWVTITLSAPG